MTKNHFSRTRHQITIKHSLTVSFYINLTVFTSIIDALHSLTRLSRKNDENIIPHI